MDELKHFDFLGMDLQTLALIERERRINQLREISADMKLRTLKKSAEKENKIKNRIFKHIKTGYTAEEIGSSYYKVVTNPGEVTDIIKKEFVEDTQDWEEVVDEIDEAQKFRIIREFCKHILNTYEEYEIIGALMQMAKVE